MKMHRKHLEKLTILVVDDNPTNLSLLFECLQEMNYSVLIAQDGESALEQIQYKVPDLILLDVMMPPGIDGFETCCRLKDNEISKDIPVIFMTALDDTESKVKGFDMGAVDYITKPLKEKEVMARVQAHLVIREQQKQLEELNASKDKFFSIIAHDLRGPLSSLNVLAQNAEEKLDDYSQEELKELFELQQTSIENLCNLLENLLTWSKIQQGMLDHYPQHLNLAEVVARNTAFLTPAAEQKCITLRNLIQEQIVVYADLNMVDTIVRNLLSNALKFTNADGTVGVSATQDETHAEVSVSDTGVGIKGKHLPKLFRIDTKYKHLGTAREKGTGLGLILCKEFVEINNGRIWITSKTGEGTTVTFTLPKYPLTLTTDDDE